MRALGIRKAFSCRDRKERVKAIKAFVSARFTETHLPTRFTRYAELKLLTKNNKYFLSHDLVMKGYKTQGVSRISQKYECFYSREAFECFEAIVRGMFENKLVCLDSMTDEQICKAESYIAEMNSPE